MRTFLLLSTLFFVFCTSPRKKEVGAKVNKVEESVSQSEEVSDEPYTKPYGDLKRETLAKRDEFKSQYTAQIGNLEKQEAVLREAEQFLVRISDDYFRSWYGTAWDFNGHTKVPRQGKIACGYFVTTVLQDMGFNLPRIKWAQQASSFIVEHTSKNIYRSSNQQMDVIKKHIQNSGEGLYIVGLDSHVGFIYYLDGKMSFVHANYYQRDIGVMSEKMIGWNPLTHSKYRIIGKIFEREMVLNWIHNTPYPEPAK